MRVNVRTTATTTTTTITQKLESRSVKQKKWWYKTDPRRRPKPSVVEAASAINRAHVLPPSLGAAHFDLVPM